jgi:hypothetical protein
VTVPNASNNTGLFTYLGRGGSTGSWTVNGSSGVGVGGQMWAYSSGSALVYMNGTDDYVIINVYGAGQASTFSLQANESKFEGFLARAA